MDHVLSYHVFDGLWWLAEDERSWTNDFHSSAAFATHELADDIGKREKKNNQTLYVLACMGSR